MSVRPVLGAIAVVLSHGRVCLVRRRNPPDAGLWGYPGGKVEPGETAMEAAARELAEETGMVARPARYLTGHDVIGRDVAGGLAHHYFLAAVLCEYLSGRPEAASDVSEAAWIDVGELLARSRPMSVGVDETLRRALEASAGTG